MMDSDRKGYYFLDFITPSEFIAIISTNFHNCYNLPQVFLHKAKYNAKSFNNIILAF